MVGFAFWGIKQSPAFIKGIALVFALSLITEIMGRYLSIHKQNNTLYYNIFHLAEANIFLYISSLVIDKRWFGKLILLAAAIYSTAFFIILFYFSGGIWQFQGKSFLVESLLLLAVYTGVLFYLTENVDVPVYKIPAAWVSIAIIFYFGCGIPVMGLLNYLIEKNMGLAYYLYTHIIRVFVILYHIMMLYAFYLSHKNTYKVSHE